MNRYIFFIAVLTPFIIFTTQPLHSNSAKNDDNQYTLELPQKQLNLFAPISFTQSDIRKFLERVFSHPLYAQDVLPNSFDHLTQCLHYTHQKYPTSLEHAQHSIDLFANKLRECEYVNAYAFELFLDDFIPLIEKYYKESGARAVHLWHESVNKIIYDALSKQFTVLREKPLQFINDLSYSITNIIVDQEACLDDITFEEFKYSCMDFLTVACSKLVWNADDDIQTWKLLKAIDSQLAKLYTGEIVNEKIINKAHKSLLERYCLFLDIFHSDLSSDFYQSVKNELSAENIPLFDHEEDEVFIETKRQRFCRALFDAEARWFANIQGLDTTA